MRLLILSFLSLALFAPASFAATGMIDVQSAHSVKQTAKRLEKALKSKGLKIFHRQDHAKGAKKIGAELRPTLLIVFGNPKAGTVLMQCQQSIAIDLPQKALIWEDAAGKVWLSYNDPKYLQSRHQMQGCEKPIENISKALANFANAATMP